MEEIEPNVLGQEVQSEERSRAEQGTEWRGEAGPPCSSTA